MSQSSTMDKTATPVLASIRTLCTVNLSRLCPAISGTIWHAFLQCRFEKTFGPGLPVESPGVGPMHRAYSAPFCFFFFLLCTVIFLHSPPSLKQRQPQRSHFRRECASHRAQRSMRMRYTNSGRARTHG